MGEPVLKTEDHFTYKDLKAWPEDERWELIDGEAVQMFSPNVEHQRAVLGLAVQLADWLKGRPCEPFVAPFDVLFRARPDQEEEDIDTVLQPDVMVVCDPEKVKRNGVHGAPDWVLEILSPSTTWRDLTIKRGVYEKHGVKEYWVLNPETRDVTIFRHDGAAFGAPSGASLKDAVPVGLFPGLTLRWEPRG